ncbi:Serine protease trypsin-like protein [Phytophthora cinnamomi]|uniref:Serine protease trypsin-like protein n=1 Tax=Phytophthora cinnamomi TaxID=4785 RepID=UPI0035595935|nr:Serine protease trypsin-like protein [Phytophthora cinnamomi]
MLKKSEAVSVAILTYDESKLWATGQGAKKALVGREMAVSSVPISHPKSSSANFSNDVAILTLERPSKFKPVALASAGSSGVKDGEWAAKMGWDDTAGSGTMAYELTRANVQLMENANCAKQTSIDDTMLCSRGATNKTSCTGDYGGPVVVEHRSGDVVVGIVSWGNNCGQPGYPSVYSRVSSARAWIESVVRGVCFH